MDELRFSLSRTLLGIRTELLPFNRYEGIADLGLGPKGGESPDPIAHAWEEVAMEAGSEAGVLRIISLRNGPEA